MSLLLLEIYLARLLRSLKYRTGILLAYVFSVLERIGMKKSSCQPLSCDIGQWFMGGFGNEPGACEMSVEKLVQLKADGIVLFIDHSLGGGANLYRRQYVDDIHKRGGRIAVLVYEPKLKRYDLLVSGSGAAYAFHAESLGLIERFLLDFMAVKEIVVSELVSYPDVYEALGMVERLRLACSACLTVLIHDYFCICPSYNLLNAEHRFCGIPDDFRICSNCLPEHTGYFRNYYPSVPFIGEWRDSWSRLLMKSDAIVCFSNSSKELLLRAYPVVPAERIFIRPHRMDYLSAQSRMAMEKVNGSSNAQIKKIITIGVLGKINRAKGEKILKEMLAIVSDRKDVRIVVIGRLSTKVKSRHLIITGPYSHEQLPHLVARYKVDVFFFPSNCPETFSFATEEIMLMNFPLAVFNIGAPAERVSAYDKGLIISSFDARVALKEILSIVS